MSQSDPQARMERQRRDEIDELIDTWHRTASAVSLHDFLGWTIDEFITYIKGGPIPDTER